MTTTVKKIQRLKKNEDFQNVFQHGRSTANRQFVVYVLAQKGQPYNRIGLSVSKKIGNAVTRNRVKRYIREIVRVLENHFNIGMDCVIIARKPTADMDYWQTKASLSHVLKKSGVLRPIKDEQK